MIANLKSIKKTILNSFFYFLVKYDGLYLRSRHRNQLKIFTEIVDNKLPKIKKQLQLDNSTNMNPMVHETWDEFSEQIFKQVIEKPKFGFFRSPVIMETMAGLHYQAQHDFLLCKIEEVFGAQTASNLLEEDAVGEPLLLRSCKYKTSLNRIIHVYQAALIYDSSKADDELTIVEWGGGFGGLARVVKKIYPKSTYVIIDLPCVIALQYLYLASVLEDSKVSILGDEGFRNGEINLVPSMSLDMVASNLNADIFVSAWALSESSESAQNKVADLKFFGATKGLLMHQKSTPTHPHAESSATIFAQHFNNTTNSEFPYWEDQIILQGTKSS